MYTDLANHTVTFGLVKSDLAAVKSGVTNTTIIQGGGSTPTPPPSSLTIGQVSNQSGVTSYATQAGDYGALVVLSDASAIAVSLTTQTPPWFCFLANQGAGTATLTPATGTISYAGNAGAASLPLLGGYCCMVAFDGTNWFAWTEPIVPATFAAVAHQFLTSYDASTGLFTAAQPAYSDISGTPTLPATIAPVTGEYLTGYDSSTGLFSQSTLAGLSVTITTAPLTSGGTQGSMTFTGGLLTAQTPAT
jgi:hypothetical protein